MIYEAVIVVTMISNDDDPFFGRSRVEELSAVTVREGGLAAELSACRSSSSRAQLTKLPTDTAAMLYS